MDVFVQSGVPNPMLPSLILASPIRRVHRPSKVRCLISILSLAPPPPPLLATAKANPGLSKSPLSTENWSGNDSNEQKALMSYFHHPNANCASRGTAPGTTLLYCLVWKAEHLYLRGPVTAFMQHDSNHEWKRPRDDVSAGLQCIFGHDLLALQHDP